MMKKTGLVVWSLIIIGNSCTALSVLTNDRWFALAALGILAPAVIISLIKVVLGFRKLASFVPKETRSNKQ